MSGFLWRMGGALAALMIGLGMLFWALELASLTSFKNGREGTDLNPPSHTFVLMFAGLVVVNLATFFALTQWSRYLHEHPKTKQLPVLLLVGVLVLAGAALVVGIALHSDWVRSLDVVTVAPKQGFIAYSVVFASVVVGTLVLLAVRWSPGFRRRPIED